MEANRTVSLAGTGRAAPQSGFGSSKVNYAATPVSTAPVPIRMKSRRVHERWFIKILRTYRKIDSLRLGPNLRCHARRLCTLGIIAYTGDAIIPSAQNLRA